ncbi:Putative membrane transport protein (plasmid) [Streptomyces clavuligerus]|uniref:Putative membrane transport protein n=1 Tax=Streptomyces clavuligerus TaxID=1901 RepID=D5SKL1_STRCL|nr:Putative membrane transport protein [Streptomyces clavuligerus]
MERPLLYSVALDTAGAGLFLPLSLLFFLNVHHMSAATAGAAVSAGSILSFLVIPAAGRLVQVMGPKRCLLISNLMTAAGYSSYFLASSGTRVFCASFIVMAADRLYGAAWPGAVARVASKEQLPQWFSFVNFLKTTCLGLGAVASTGLLALAGPAGLKVALMGNCLSSLAAAFFVLRTRIPPGGTGVQPGATDSRATLMSTLKNSAFMALVSSQTLLSLAWLIPTVAFPIYLVDVLHHAAFWPAAVIAVRYAVISAIQIPLGNRVAGWSRSRVLVLAIAAAETAILTTMFISSAPAVAQGWMAVLATVLLAVAEAASKPTAAAAAVALAPDRDEGPYMAVFQLTWAVSYAVGPALIGWGMGHALLLWCVLGGCVLISGLVQVLSPERRRFAR